MIAKYCMYHIFFFFFCLMYVFFFVFCLIVEHQCFITSNFISILCQSPLVLIYLLLFQLFLDILGRLLCFNKEINILFHHDKLANKNKCQCPTEENNASTATTTAATAATDPSAATTQNNNIMRSSPSHYPRVQQTGSSLPRRRDTSSDMQASSAHPHEQCALMDQQAAAVGMGMGMGMYQRQESHTTTYSLATQDSSVAGGRLRGLPCTGGTISNYKQQWKLVTDILDRCFALFFISLNVIALVIVFPRPTEDYFKASYS